MILYDGTQKVFRLDTPATSYCMGIADQVYLGHLYYGPRLSGMDLSYLLRTDEGTGVPSRCPGEQAGFLNRFPMEYPVCGTGDFREGCIDVRTEAGQNGVLLQYRSHRIFAGKKALPGLPAAFGDHCETLEITLEDPDISLSVVLSYTVFTDSDVICRSARITNTGSGTLQLVRAMSAALTFDNRNCELLTLNGAWARERHIQRQKLSYGGYCTESLRGEPGHESQPFLGILSEHCTQTTGEVRAMHLIYSGNFLGKVQLDANESLRAVLGIHPQNFCWELAPGASFQTPEAVLVYSGAGLGLMTRSLHDFYRRHLIRSPWQNRERPVLVNSWEAVYFDFNSEKLCAMAETAAKCGIGLFVLDDGWFGHRDRDNSSLGDWTTDRRKLPEGLPALSDRIHGLGMKFGLWFEPEMISEDSDLFRAHPDWVMRTAVRRPVSARNQWVLDLTRPEAEAYIADRLSDLIRTAHIDYIKWDMNRSLIDIGTGSLPAARQGETVHRQVLALYRLQERLFREFPELLLENCSSGGARFDPGMLYYSPQIWCSDDSDPIERLSILEGTALVYPLSAIGSHVCKQTNDITGCRSSFELRVLVSLFGTFGYELDLTKLSAEEQAAVPGQLAIYRQLEPLIQRGSYYRLASVRENHAYDSFEIAAPDRAQAFVLYVQVTALVNHAGRILQLAGLDPDADYEVRITAGSPSAAYRENYCRCYRGSTLMFAGLPMPKLSGDGQAVILELRRVSGPDRQESGICTQLRDKKESKS